MTPIVENVLETYRSASFWAFSEGMRWYDDAHDFARILDPADPKRAAGIIAVLSPMNEWENNKRMAARFYAANGNVVIADNGKNGYGLSKNVAKAIRIWNGEDADAVVNGPKVTSFYRTILNPAGDIDPVIDRHAFDIAVGMRTNDKARGILGRKSVYQSFVNVYRTAADIVGVGPKQLQAITWVSWKENYGIAL